MNQNGSNFVALVLDTSLLVAVNKKASENGQLNATYLLSVIVEHCKEELSEDAYKKLKMKYSISAEEQMIAKKLKQKERLDMKKKELELKERDIALREKNAAFYRKQTQLSIDKKKKEIEKELRMANNRKNQITNANSSDYAYSSKSKEERLAETEEEIERLKSKLRKLDSE
jgi:hypothetical protein